MLGMWKQYKDEVVFLLAQHRYQHPRILVHDVKYGCESDHFLRYPVYRWRLVAQYLENAVRTVLSSWYSCS